MRKKVQEEYDRLTVVFKKRQVVYDLLEKFFREHNYIPEGHEGDWDVWTRQEQRIPWHQQPFVVARLKMTARRNVSASKKKR